MLCPDSLLARLVFLGYLECWRLFLPTILVGSDGAFAVLVSRVASFQSQMNSTMMTLGHLQGKLQIAMACFNSLIRGIWNCRRSFPLEAVGAQDMGWKTQSTSAINCPFRIASAQCSRSGISAHISTASRQASIVSKNSNCK